tara:strand:+ start:4169 stop:4585 length:417 start_codon:yes stop_codon:yes gene_type:complete
VDHPTEDGVRFEIRGLSWVQMDDARSKAAAGQREVLKDLGADFLAALGSTDPDESERAMERLEEQRYHPTQFDTGTLLKAGVVDWNYTNGSDEDVPVSDETLEQLDEATAVFLVEQIINITRPPEGRSAAAAVSVSGE